jgi:hypothetical protein
MFQEQTHERVKDGAGIEIAPTITSGHNSKGTPMYTVKSPPEGVGWAGRPGLEINTAPSPKASMHFRTRLCENGSHSGWRTGLGSDHPYNSLASLCKDPESYVPSWHLSWQIEPEAVRCHPFHHNAC